MTKIIVIALLLPSFVFANEPLLPFGLGNSEALLLNGLSDDSKKDIIKYRQSDWRLSLPFELNGFLESIYGNRLQDDQYEKDASVAEIRGHFTSEYSSDIMTYTLSFDLIYDNVAENNEADLENGKGWMDLREANILYRVNDDLDIKIGRQTLTWGTGDLIFINDMFPKDWNSFFIGRDDEYLKAPSNALKFAYFTEFVNLNFVYSPDFDSDRYIDGSRISYYNNNFARIAGRDALIITDENSQLFKEDEIAVRLYKNINAIETALYFYNGYWKSPEGQNQLTGLYYFPKLSVYGASARGSLFKGIANAELGFYKSLDDKSGVNAFVRNSEWRFLIGYEQEIIPEFTGSFQYYFELMDDYKNYKVNLLGPAYQKDKLRQVITLRLTKLMLNQNLKFAFYNFYSPTDNDGYTRLKISYKLNDNWTTAIGGNFFYGDNIATFFNQFNQNTNMFLSLRYSF